MAPLVVSHTGQNGKQKQLYGELMQHTALFIAIIEIRYIYSSIVGLNRVIVAVQWHH